MTFFLGYVIKEIPKAYKKLLVRLEGALLPPYYSNLSRHSLLVWVQYVVTTEPLQNNSALKETNVLLVQNISEVWKVPLVSENLIGVVPEVKQKHEFKLKNFTKSSNGVLKIKMKTNLKANLPLSLIYDLEPINMNDGIIYAALILIGLYAIIIFEVIHRTLAAMLASTMSVAVLAALNARPTMAEIVSWIDVETLLLLFSMMTLVTIFSETGIFDYTAVLAYKLTKGKEWPLINALCFLTAFLSCFLDNVTTALLMTPITIRLCEVMRMEPVPVLICMIIYSNIGGAITPIGDPPNVIIASNPDIAASGVNFGTFTLHMGIGVVLSSVLVHIQLRCLYRNVKDLRYTDAEPQEVRELRREIAVWQRAAACMSSYSRDEEIVKETLKKRTTRLLGQLNNATNYRNLCNKDYAENLKDLQNKYPIKDMSLLIKSGLTLFLVITLFFLHSIPELSRLGLGWTALLGTLLLLLLYDRDDVESIFARVEWSTLLFFASLFILMEALARMGLIDWIGQQTQNVIMSVEQESRLAVAILLILWVSACASAFVDNIPLTTMMVRIATVLADDQELNLPLQPLVWALAFGACFGGNGTLFGSSSNIVCAGVAEQHGHRFTFMQFMKYGLNLYIN
ncbi:hypothetical protein ILUMI_11899 [Ignelater luminosus]|uniref:Citrate transporter-like domain-containing protein n=1 Tax=Ignelater luminosus TaxID=2038154 RepID=A0A8K0CV88_IGNLU|nr:hypothetical protein ILUMI_11899 [Ignelater luminosus]